jgi:hypothetical protein
MFQEVEFKKVGLVGNLLKIFIERIEVLGIYHIGNPS